MTAELPPRTFFLIGARLGFGVWLLYAGLTKWISGPHGFVGYITEEFAKTWSPAPLNTVLAWLIIISEPLVALWLLTGFRQRSAWTAAALLMFLLLTGMTILQKPEVFFNFGYWLFCLLCAAWAGSDSKA